MAGQRKSQESFGALDLIEEAVHLLRQAPAGAWAAYFLGAAPFTLGLLYFWSEMSQSGLAWRHQSLAALGMALLFLWLKCWQAVFCQRLRSQFAGMAAAPWTWRAALRLVARQGAWQPTALFVLPVAAVVMLPLGWVFAYYQNLSALDAGQPGQSPPPHDQAIACAKAWPRQNHFLMAVLSLLGFFILVNWISAFVLVPYLLKSWLGIETLFSRSSDAYLNTTFYATVLILSWLTMDPLIKAAYTLRCFYTMARTTGEDLRAELRRLGGSALPFLALLLGLFPTGALAAEAIAAKLAAAAPAELDQAIQQVLEQREYIWRIPKEDLPKPELDTGFLEQTLQSIGTTLEGWLKSVGRGLERFGKWLDKLLGGRRLPRLQPGQDNVQSDWLSPLRLLMLLLIVAIIIVAGVLVYRFWRRHKKRAAVETQPEAPTAMPDLTAEHVAANQLPEDEWLAMARDLANRGDLRLALRAYYLAALASLGQRQLVAIAKFKSNRDYERELGRRAHSLPGLPELFHAAVLDFERVWYGLHEVEPGLLHTYEDRVQRLRAT